MAVEERATLSSADRAALPDSAFAHVEHGHSINGKTPDKYRHYPIHDAAHVKAALSRIADPSNAFAAEAKPKVLAAAKRLGIGADKKGRSMDSLVPEVRFVKSAPELRIFEGENGAAQHITGYAAVFEKRSRRLGNFVENVRTTTFDESRAAGFPDVVCRYNHRDDMVLGTTNAKTCVLEVDERGLNYDVDPPKARADVLELVQRGDVRYSSFAFRCNEGGDEWGVTEFNFPLRSLHSVELLDVAPVMDPAYHDTSAAARNMTGAVDSLARWVHADPAEVRSMMEAGQAMRFFKRTDRASAPKLTPEAAEERQAETVDDEAVSLHTVKTDEAPAETEQDRSMETPENDEERKITKAADLCLKYCHGEPCVKQPGHDGECEPRCYARGKEGLPCGLPMDHEGAHVPMAVDDGKTRAPATAARSADGIEAETRDADGKLTPEAIARFKSELETRAAEIQAEQRALEAQAAAVQADLTAFGTPAEVRDEAPKPDTMGAAQAMFKMAELRTRMITNLDAFEAADVTPSE